MIRNDARDRFTNKAAKPVVVGDTDGIRDWIAMTVWGAEYLERAGLFAHYRVLNDPRRPRDYSPEQYLKSAEEMAALFADIPEALRNTVEIARRCSLPLKLGESRLPVYPLPDGVSVETHIREQSLRGFEAREKAFDPTQRARLEEYRLRLDRELGVISAMGFAGYFLIVADFIKWARENGVPSPGSRSKCR